MAYDPEFRQAAVKTFERLGIDPNRPTQRFPKGDIKSRRQASALVKAALSLDLQYHPEIEKTLYKISGYEHGEISLFAYRNKNVQSSSPTAAVLYIHGGGMIFGSTELFEPAIESDVAATGVAYFSMYILSPTPESTVIR